MNLRTAWLALVQHHALDRPAALQLESLAPWHEPPPQLQRHLWRTVAVLAAALGGLGIVMWIASNWDTLGRPARFALLQGFVAVMYAGRLCEHGSKYDVLAQPQHPYTAGLIDCQPAHSSGHA